MTKRIYVLCAALALLLCQFAIAETVRGNLEERYSSVPSIEVNGEKHRLRSRVTSILLMGIDQRELAEGAEGEFRVGGQADFQMLIVVDEGEKTITPIQINRDAMVEVDVLNLSGQVSGTRWAQICLAHSFGDGGEMSCQLAVSALSRLLMGTPIDHYLSMRMDGIAELNDAIGGVEVTLEDDYSMYDPQMTQGKTLVLQGKQAEIFVRNRYYIGPGSNEYRLDRQKIYLEAAVDIVMERLEESSSYLLTLFDAVDTYCVTDISRGKMLNLAKQAVDYEILPILSLPGEAVLAESGYIEFIVDEAALLEMLAGVLY